MAQPGRALIRAAHRAEDQALRPQIDRGTRRRYRTLHRNPQQPTPTVPLEQLSRLYPCVHRTLLTKNAPESTEKVNKNSESGH